MIQGLTFASCYVYSPGGGTAMCARSRLLRAMLKEGDRRFILKYAVRVRQQVEQASQLRGFFLPQDVLVPVPGSAPKRGGTWVAAELAQALLQAGMGSMIWPGLQRISPVRKSATAPRGARPSVVLHYRSFRIERPLFRADSVVLIDDVITRGRTLLAAAARMHEAFPDAQIRAFALLRTLGMVAGVAHLLEPCVGEIRWRAGDARRIP